MFDFCRTGVYKKPVRLDHDMMENVDDFFESSSDESDESPFSPESHKILNKDEATETKYSKSATPRAPISAAALRLRYRVRLDPDGFENVDDFFTTP